LLQVFVVWQPHSHFDDRILNFEVSEAGSRVMVGASVALIGGVDGDLPTKPECQFRADKILGHVPGFTLIICVHQQFVDHGFSRAASEPDLYWVLLDDVTKGSGKNCLSDGNDVVTHF